MEGNFGPNTESMEIDHVNRPVSKINSFSYIYGQNKPPCPVVGVLSSTKKGNGIL